MSGPLLRVEGLETHFAGDEGVVRAVDGIDLVVDRGEVVALVGESGCGKSATALSILGLLPRPAGSIAAGRVLLEGRDLVSDDDEGLRRVRGDRVAMIFQDPMTSLNPFLRIGEQLVEVMELHRGTPRPEARKRAAALLTRVGIAGAERSLDAYPHEFSGGMRQRVMIAMALLCDPELLIADEPTTALDVTIQAQILDLLRELRDERGLAVLLITHDLGIVAGLADRIVVMYAGRIVEEAPTRELFRAPGHPYTAALLASLPHGRRGRLQGIAGAPPRLDRPLEGCRFAPRCPRVEARCREAEPELAEEGRDRRRRCILPRAD